MLVDSILRSSNSAIRDLSYVRFQRKELRTAKAINYYRRISKKTSFKIVLTRVIRKKKKNYGALISNFNVNNLCNSLKIMEISSWLHADTYIVTAKTHK